MQIRTRARYSVRMMMAISKLATEKPVGLGDVSKLCSVSRRYLEQLAPALKNAGLIRATSGRRGGYSLARDATDIKINDIITAAIGPIQVTDCVGQPQTCINHEYCNCRGLWSLLNLKINDVLDSFTLADVLSEDFNDIVNQEIEIINANAKNQKPENKPIYEVNP